MSSIFRRAVELGRSEGVVVLGREILNYPMSRLWPAVVDRYWDVRGGTQRITVRDVTVAFDAASDLGGSAFRRRFKAERTLLEDVLRELRCDDVFFDIGANIGNFSCFASQVTADGTVVAFEPYPPNLTQLRRNLDRNATDANVQIVNKALSDESGVVEFTAPRRRSVGMGTASMRPAGDSMEVEAVPGDELVQKRDIPRPDVVKIDVEGAEMQVIRGLEETLSDDRCRTLYCEVHLPAEHRTSIRDFDESPEQVIEALNELGFGVDYELDRGVELQLKASKRGPAPRP